MEESTPTVKVVDDPSQLSFFTQAEGSEPTPQVQQDTMQVNEPAQVQQPAGLNDEQVIGFLSERLGRTINSFDELSGYINKPQSVEIDERVKAINEFVRTTKRNPEDWFKYQSYDPDAMDEVSLIKASMALEHPNLSAKEIDILAKSKYKIGKEDFMDDDELELHKLTLKVDADMARKKIQQVRDDFAAPSESDDNYNPFDDQWMSNMTRNANEIEALEFSLPNGETFSYGIDEKYRPQLIESNRRIDEFFDQYVENGDWNFEKLNAHRTLIDNIDKIVASAYNQGISAGQRGVVTAQANVSVPNARQMPVTPSSSDKVASQIRDILGSDMVTFKF